MTKYLQYGLALVLGSLYLVLIPDDDVANIIALAAILFFGVPHGAIDHKIHLKFSKKSNVKKFILIYVLVGLGFLLWWVLMPLKALLIFIILSAYHFGQELIEDNAESIGGKYKGKLLGTLGDLSTYSFFGNKIMTTGEGGILCTNDRKIYNFCKSFRSHGMIDRDTHEFLGYNYRMGEINAAIGRVQLKKIKKLFMTLKILLVLIFQ